MLIALRLTKLRVPDTLREGPPGLGLGKNNGTIYIIRRRNGERWACRGNIYRDGDMRWVKPGDRVDVEKWSAMVKQ